MKLNSDSHVNINYNSVQLYHIRHYRAKLYLFITLRIMLWFLSEC